MEIEENIRPMKNRYFCEKCLSTKYLHNPQKHIIGRRWMVGEAFCRQCKSFMKDLKINNLNPQTTFDHLLFLGDTHGYTNNFQITSYLLPQYNINHNKESTAIVHCGDFGVGFCRTVEEELYKLSILNEDLKKHNIFLYIIRGNHDDPLWFNTPTEKIIEYFNDNNIENLVLMPDHTMIYLNLKDKSSPTKIYCIGGAISIDRRIRTKNLDYWELENFHLPSLEQLNEIPNDLDIIVTHTRPEEVLPLGTKTISYWFLKDDKLEKDLNIEVSDISSLFNLIREKNNKSGKEIQHFYGHFHMSLTSYTEKIKHICLNINELYYYRK